jgi:hypothetical protein
MRQVVAVDELDEAAPQGLRGPPKLGAKPIHAPDYGPGLRAQGSSHQA